MAGIRYDGWKHKRVVGEFADADAYLPEARKLLGQVYDDAAHNKLGSHKMVVELEDGAVITAEKIGQQPRITIQPPVRKPPVKTRRAPEDFVVHPRDQARPDGIDPDFPQLILQPNDVRWKTYFKNTAIDGYEDFSGSKGTYGGIFVEGIVHAGNIDWRGPKGERISWYGPSSRYWYDTWRQPNAQYGKFVFTLGQVLLDVDQYCVDNEIDIPERLVLGAALRFDGGQNWLYVVFGAMDDIVFDATPIPPNSLYFSENFPLGNIQMSLARFAILRDEDSLDAQQWSVIDGSYEQLFDFFANRACNPWVFDRDCKKCTTMILQGSPVYVFSDAYGYNLFNTPPATTDRVDIMFDDGVTPSFTNLPQSLAAGPGSGLLAIDYDEKNVELQVSLVRQPYQGSTNAIWLDVAGWQHPIFYLASPAEAGFEQTAVRRMITWVDARSKAAVLDIQDSSWKNTNPPWQYNIVRGRVYVVDGIVQKTEISATFYEPAAAGPGIEERTINQLDAIAEVDIAPVSLLWQLRALTGGAFRQVAIVGLGSPNARIPFCVDDTFGGMRATGGSPAVPLPVSGFATTNFANDKVDVHGHRSAVGVAAYKGTMVCSAYSSADLTETGADTSISEHYITDTTMAAATEVTGTYARHHPVWLLGKPIGGEL